MTKQQKTKPTQKKPPETDAKGLFQALRYSLWSPAKQLSAWIFVAAIAAAYLYALLFGPAGGVRIASDGIYPLPASSAKSQLKRPFDIETLARELQKMQRQISMLKQRELLLETRLADLQSALGPTTSALPAKDGSAASRANTSRRPAPAVDQDRSPLPGAGFGDDLASKSPIPSEPVRQPTRTMFAVELGQDQSVSDIRKRWLALVVKYAPQLKDLEVRYVAVDPAAGDKSALRLIAGPFSNAADAALVCAKLSAKKQSCEQTVFAGEKLGETALSIPDRKPKRRKN